MKVYIAGPYTKGDVAVNVRNAIMAGQVVYESGHYPFIPHLTHFWHLLCPADVEQWYEIDMVWLPHCDALIRLPGDSIGADKEVAQARMMGKPVYSLTEFLHKHGRKRG